MRIGKVIPVYRGIYIIFQIIDQRPYFQNFLFMVKLYVDRLDYFTKKHQLLLDTQYGFRANRSTTMASINLTE